MHITEITRNSFTWVNKWNVGGKEALDNWIHGTQTPDVPEHLLVYSTSHYLNAVFKHLFFLTQFDTVPF